LGGIVLIRDATPADELFLRSMLYLAVFVPPGHPAPPPGIVDEPALANYVTGFGTRQGDLGFVAEEDRPVGAAWVRRLPGGYGYVDDRTAELSMAVASRHRGRGIGTALLERMLGRVPRCSLSVDDRNRARALYERSGFVVVARDGHSLTMLRDPDTLKNPGN
jgi:ribosomal protein S18 acetylase RimI-like enzyme